MPFASALPLIALIVVQGALAEPPRSPTIPDYSLSVRISTVAAGPSENIEGTISAVQRANFGSGYFWFAHVVTLRTDAGSERQVLFTSLDPQIDRLPTVGDHCRIIYRLAQSTAGLLPLEERSSCNGVPPPISR